MPTSHYRRPIPFNCALARNSPNAHLEEYWPKDPAKLSKYQAVLRLMSPQPANPKTETTAES